MSDAQTIQQPVGPRCQPVTEQCGVLEATYKDRIVRGRARMGSGRAGSPLQGVAQDHLATTAEIVRYLYNWRASVSPFLTHMQVQKWSSPGKEKVFFII